MKKKTEIKVIECSGNHFEIGQQYGSACRENLVASIESLFTDIGTARNASKSEIISVAMKYLPLVEDFDPDLIEMLRGQALGACVSFDEVFTLRCKLELGMYYQHITALCTSFVVTGDATKGGKTIIGQTYDLGPGTTIELVRNKFEDGLEQLSLVVGCGAGGELPLTSHGLGMALNIMLSPAAEQRLNVPCACVIPKTMRQKRIGDALGIVCSAGRSLLYYAFASGEGDIIGIETRPDDFNVIQPEKDILVHSNHYLTDRFKRSDNFFGFMEGDSYLRIQRMRRLIEKHYGELTPEMMGEFMADHNDYPRSICKHTDMGVQLGETLAAVVMVPGEGLMQVACGQPCTHEFLEYRLK